MITAFFVIFFYHRPKFGLDFWLFASTAPELHSLGASGLEVCWRTVCESYVLYFYLSCASAHIYFDNVSCASAHIYFDNVSCASAHIYFDNVQVQTLPKPENFSVKIGMAAKRRAPFCQM